MLKQDNLGKNVILEKSRICKFLEIPIWSNRFIQRVTCLSNFESILYEFNRHIYFTLIQWILSISTTLYLEHLSISNKKRGPLDICVLSKLFLSLYLELFYLEFFSISNKNLGPLRLFLSLSRTFSRLRVHLHSKQNKNARYLKIRMLSKRSKFENSIATKILQSVKVLFELRKLESRCRLLNGS